MTYDEAVRVWYGRINYEVKAAAPADLKLERMRALLGRCGDPHGRVRCAHIAGTKGKGSTAAVLDAVLRAAGYRVGLFTSPHLVHVEERIRVDGVPISRDELAALITELEPAIRATDPSFFEIGTALGFLHFARRRCDFNVVEVGLGGRFDSTNVCDPLVSILTGIGLDHTAQLGDTLEAIAYQKAGILKRNTPAVSGVLQPGPRAVVRAAADELNCRLTELGETLTANYDAGSNTATITLNGQTLPPMHLGLLGRHQAANAALVVAAVAELRRAGLTIPDTAVAAGLKNVVWLGRVEVVGRDPVRVLDSAHNVPSIEALLDTLRKCLPTAGRKHCVFAVSNDKPYAEMLAILAQYFDAFHFCRYGTNPRAVPPEELAALAPGTVHGTAAAAWAAAVTAAGPHDLVCATGSVFLAGELTAHQAL